MNYTKQEWKDSTNKTKARAFKLGVLRGLANNIKRTNSKNAKQLRDKIK